MAITTTTPLEVVNAVRRLGENVRLARLRRRMSQEELAQACDITRKTLYALETGNAGTTVGSVFKVLWKLGLMSTASALADPDFDEHGKILEAASRPKRARQPAPSDNDF
ncbi:MAG: helix-turn-helix transcriptional regulator [Pseudomonadota bacterium]